jgi:hypothetical protein
MSIGNLKDQGNRSNNFPYQLANLQLLGGIKDCCTTSGGTLLSILAALQNGQNFIQTLVEDQGGTGCPANCPVYLEVRIWNGTTFDPPVYYDAEGNVVIPVGPVVYLNPDFHLAQMVLLLTSIDADTSNIAADTTATRTAKVISTSTSGTIPGNPMTVSIFNANTMSGAVTIGGTTISVPGGVTLSYDAGGLNNKFATGNFVYDATGTTFIITYVI